MKNRELSPYSDHDLWTRLSPKEIANDCIRLPKAGAQSTTFRLPAYFNHEIWLSDTFEDTLEMPRVLKIAHYPWEIEAAVTSMDIHGQEAQLAKASQLSVANQTSTTWAVHASKTSPRLEKLFGHPLIVEPRRTSLMHAGFYFAYTQDLGNPLWETFIGLDPEHNEEDFRAACRFIDRYIDAELFLCSKGIFDPTFKLLENCSTDITVDPHAHDADEHFMITDLGEFIFYNLPDILKYVREKAWRRTATQPEYIPLSPSVRAYFDEAFDARLTEEAVQNVWATDMDTEPNALGENARMADLPILAEVTELLRAAKA